MRCHNVGVPPRCEPARWAEPTGPVRRRTFLMVMPLGVLSRNAASREATAATAPAPAVGDRMRLIGQAAANTHRLARAQADALPPTPRAPTARTRALEQAVFTAMGGRSPVMGVSVLDRRSGIGWNYRGTALIRTGSVGKVLVVAEALRRARAAGSTLTGRQREQASRAITASDNSSANALYRHIGGTAAVARLAARLGMAATATATPAGDWGHLLTSPNDLVTMMSGLTGASTVLHEDDCAYLLGLMGKVVDGQRWGVGTVGSSSVTVRVKNGWMAVDDPWVINSVGDVRGNGRDYVLAVMQRAQPEQDPAIRRASRIGRAVYAALADPLA